MGRFGSDPSPPANVQAAKVAQKATAFLGGKPGMRPDVAGYLAAADEGHGLGDGKGACM